MAGHSGTAASHGQSSQLTSGRPETHRQEQGEHKNSTALLGYHAMLSLKVVRLCPPWKCALPHAKSLSSTNSNLFHLSHVARIFRLSGKVVFDLNTTPLKITQAAPSCGVVLLTCHLSSVSTALQDRRKFRRCFVTHS